MHAELARRTSCPAFSSRTTFVAQCRLLSRSALHLSSIPVPPRRCRWRGPIPVVCASDAASSGMRAFDAEDNWQALAGSYPEGWSGWRGQWGLFDSDGSQTKSWIGARLFHHDGDGGYEQVNVYDQVVSPGDPGKERSDGGYEKSWRFNKLDSCCADGWWHPYLKQEGLQRMRIIGISPPRTATVCFALPAEDHLKSSDAAVPFWNMELFVRPEESERSYSCGAAYNSVNGQFQTLFYIREARSTEGPAERAADYSLIDSTCRPSLPQDVNEWASACGTAGRRWQDMRGVSQQLVFDDDGGIGISAEEATTFEPPCSSLRTTCLPDAMYMAYPGKVPTELADVPAEGLTFEFGGIRPTASSDGGSQGSGFSRTVLRYGPNGLLSSIRFDDFEG